jgi:hypothetical protein
MTTRGGALMRALEAIERKLKRTADRVALSICRDLLLQADCQSSAFFRIVFGRVYHPHYVWML